MTRHSGETTIMKHVHDGLDGGISNLFDEASLPAPNWSRLDHVNLGTGLQAASGSPAVAANTILNHVPATGSPGIGSIWFQSDDGAAAPNLPAAVEAANVPVPAATIGQTTYFSYNGGATLSSLAYNNEYNGGSKVNGGDTADFTQVDVFGTGFPGEANSLSATDIQLMEALGWSAARLGRPSNRLHIKVGADLMISPDVNDAMAIKNLLLSHLHVSDFHFV